MSELEQYVAECERKIAALEARVVRLEARIEATVSVASLEAIEAVRRKISDAMSA